MICIPVSMLAVPVVRLRLVVVTCSASFLAQHHSYYHCHSVVQLSSIGFSRSKVCLCVTRIGHIILPSYTPDAQTHKHTWRTHAHSCDKQKPQHQCSGVWHSRATCGLRIRRTEASFNEANWQIRSYETIMHTVQYTYFENDLKYYKQ